MKRVLLALLALGLFFTTAWTALTQVRPGERAVVRRFGRILPEQPGPGLYVGWPWGIDQVERISVQGIRSITVGYRGKNDDEESATPQGQLLTGDHNLVNVQAVIHFTVVESEVTRYFLQRDRAEKLIARAAEAALAEWVAGRSVDEVRGPGRTLLPGALVADVRARLQPYDLGVRIEAANVIGLHPPDEVKDAFDAVAQAYNRRVTQVNAAEEKAKSTLRGAEGDVFRRARQAEAYGRNQRLQAQAEAENFEKRLEQYRRLRVDNAAYLNTLWLDEMTRLYARMKEAGRLDLLDHYLTGDGLSILQFPPLPRKK